MDPVTKSGIIIILSLRGCNPILHQSLSISFRSRLLLPWPALALDKEAEHPSPDAEPFVGRPEPQLFLVISFFLMSFISAMMLRILFEIAGFRYLSEINAFIVTFVLNHDCVSVGTCEFAAIVGPYRLPLLKRFVLYQ